MTSDSPNTADIVERLKRSVELESLADFQAMSFNFGEAADLMGYANRIRRRIFGRCDPNELREHTRATLAKVTKP